MYKTLVFLLGLSFINTAFNSAMGQTCSRRGETDREKPAFYAALADVDPACPDLAVFPESVRKGIEFLKSTDLAALPMGRTDIDGDNVYVNKMEYETKPAEQARPEGHHKYIDIQYILSGEEEIGVVAFTDGMPVEEEYNEEKEVWFAPISVMPFLTTGEKSANIIFLSAGQFVIFTPHEIHAPSLTIDKSVKVVKLVVKCKVD